jgi:cytochrome c556
MLKSTKTLLTSITAISSMLLTASVMGQDSGRPTPDQSAVKYRQALMVVIEAQSAPLLLMQRGRAPYDAAVVSRNTAALVAMVDLIPAAFERNTSAASVKTETLPATWQNHADFLKEAETLKTQTKALEAAVKAGNQEQVKTAIKNVDTACGGCHTKYRQM